MTEDDFVIEGKNREQEPEHLSPRLPLQKQGKFKPTVGGSSETKRIASKVEGLQQQVNLQRAQLNIIGSKIHLGGVTDIEKMLESLQLSIKSLERQKQSINDNLTGLKHTNQYENALHQLSALSTQIEILKSSAAELEYLLTTNFKDAAFAKNEVMTLSAKAQKHPEQAHNLLKLALEKIQCFANSPNVYVQEMHKEAEQVIAATILKISSHEKADTNELAKLKNQLIIEATPINPETIALGKKNISIPKEARFRSAFLMFHKHIRPSINEIERIAAQLIETRKTLDHALEKPSETKENIEQLKTTLNSLKEKLNTQSTFLLERTQSRISYEAQQYAQTWASEIKNLDKKIERLEASLDPGYVALEQNITKGFQLLGQAQNNHKDYNISETAFQIFQATTLLKQLSTEGIDDLTSKKLLVEKIDLFKKTLEFHQNSYLYITSKEESSFDKLLKTNSFNEKDLPKLLAFTSKALAKELCTVSEDRRGKNADLDRAILLLQPYIQKDPALQKLMEEYFTVTNFENRRLQAEAHKTIYEECSKLKAISQKMANPFAALPPNYDQQGYAFAKIQAALDTLKSRGIQSQEIYNEASKMVDELTKQPGFMKLSPSDKKTLSKLMSNPKLEIESTQVSSLLSMVMIRALHLHDADAKINLNYLLEKCDLNSLSVALSHLDIKAPNLLDNTLKGMLLDKMSEDSKSKITNLIGDIEKSTSLQDALEKYQQAISKYLEVVQGNLDNGLWRFFIPQRFDPNAPVFLQVRGDLLGIPAKQEIINRFPDASSDPLAKIPVTGSPQEIIEFLQNVKNQWKHEPSVLQPTAEERASVDSQLVISQHPQEQKMQLYKFWQKLLLNYPVDKDSLETVKRILRDKFYQVNSSEYRALNDAQKILALRPSPDADPQKLQLECLKKMGEIELSLDSKIEEMKAFDQKLPATSSLKKALEVFTQNLELIVSQIAEALPQDDEELNAVRQRQKASKEFLKRTPEDKRVFIENKKTQYQHLPVQEQEKKVKEDIEYLNFSNFKNDYYKFIEKYKNDKNIINSMLQALDTKETQPLAKLFDSSVVLMNALRTELSQVQDSEQKSLLDRMSSSLTNTCTTVISSLFGDIMKTVRIDDGVNRSLIESSYKKMAQSNEKLQEIVGKRF